MAYGAARGPVAGVRPAVDTPHGQSAEGCSNIRVT